MLETKWCTNLKKFTILLFLILLPTVSASSFTGSFTDYGKDTNSDGLFNYLTIEAGASITQANSYMIFGRLKDSEGNFVEYEDCKSLSTGNYNFILDFDGRQIYRHKVNGSYSLDLIELSSVNDCVGQEFPILEDSLENAYTTSFYDYKEFQKGKPAIYCNNSPCIASSTLIKSRDNLDTPEPNAPNTIDNCKDGTKGFYLDSESIESVTITSLNHSFFDIGDTVKVDIWVYCDSLSDKLNLVYSNDVDDIEWKVKSNTQCSSIGLRKLSTTFNLDNNIGNHSIRGVFSFNLQSNTICGEDDPQKDWADNDDIIIYVKDSQEGKYPIDLTKGWNLISLPKIDNYNITEISNLFNNFEKIITLKEGKWYIYDKTPNSNLKELSEANGFWIKTTDNLTVLIENESAAYTPFQLTKGWNLIGYPSMEEKDVNEVFQNVIDDIELIYIYNNEFSSFNPKNPSSFIIKPGTGIFVKIKNDVSWYFDNTYRKGQQSFNLSLSQGWNLISIPLSSNKTISEIFGSNILYYLKSNNWRQLEGSDEINYSYGYWIKTNPDILPVQGYRINNIYYDINQGWNLINYPLTQETDIDVFLLNVIDNIELANTYEDGEWKSFSSLKPSQLNSLTTLKPGKGIFIKAKNNAQWYFDGNELEII